MEGYCHKANTLLTKGYNIICRQTVYLINQSKSGQIFSIKGQIVTILSFEAMVSRILRYSPGSPTSPPSPVYAPCITSRLNMMDFTPVIEFFCMAQLTQRWRDHLGGLKVSHEPFKSRVFLWLIVEEEVRCSK